MNAIVALLISTLIVVHGYRKKRYPVSPPPHHASLSISGVVSSFFVGLLAMLAGIDYTAGVLSFYFSSSYFTKVGVSRKKIIEEDHKPGGQRNVFQVLSNGAAGIIICLLVLLHPNLAAPTLRTLRICYVCHYCVCNGDTWASELGSVFGGTPRSVAGLRRVPAGTNGGLSPLGLGASFLGGSFVALSFTFFSYLNGAPQAFSSPFEAAWLGGVFGFVGSMV